MSKSGSNATTQAALQTSNQGTTWLRWNLGVSLTSGIFLLAGLVLGQGLRTFSETTNALNTHLSSFNDVSYGLFIAILLSSAGLLAKAAWNCSSPKPKLDCVVAVRSILTWTRCHPVSAVLLMAYSVMIVANSSWFYKEIVTWFDDIQASQLLDNFSLRSSLINEVRGRNDFRFFPLSHQDLHILSWFTPFPKIWGIASAIELVVTVLAAVKIMEKLRHWRTHAGITLITSLTYLFTTSSAYNYFQFIYSERILTLCLSLFSLCYLHYQRKQTDNIALTTLLFALFGCFTKDTGILLFTIPAVATILLGSFGLHENYPHWRQASRTEWLHAYRLELSILCLTLVFATAFTWMSYIPGILAGDQRYDASLGFTTFEPDLRWLILMLYTLTRGVQIIKRRDEACLLDTLNLGAIAYCMVLFALIGFQSSSYMNLPIQWIAVLDIVFIWCAWITPKLGNNWGRQNITLLGAGLSAGIIALDHLSPSNFYNQARDMHLTQRSWQATIQEAIKLSRQSKEIDQEVNFIFSKSWFKHSEYLRSLPFDRLIYIDPDTRETRVIEGINKGQIYQPKQGDFFLNIDSGKKLNKYGINLDAYDLIFEYTPSISTGKIYRHR
jgi:hypothetical protein